MSVQRDTACGSDPMLMFFTSGTTGYPKIAEHNYKYALGHYITAKYWHNVNPRVCTSPSRIRLGQGAVGQVVRPVDV